MTYVALYRKWRPQDFSDVVGQDNIVQTLGNSLNTGRISHAYLFAGPRGTGKTTVARILAKGLNCLQGPTSDPCGICEECQTITTGTSLNVIEIDGASNNGVDDVRELRGQVQYAPVNAKYKVYIIDEVHMLSISAFNALLKTLEEPPAHVVFIFATTDPHRLPATILSRVQRYDFQRFTEKALVARLETIIKGESLIADEQALQLIAQHATGAMRDALGILEKCATFSDQISVDAVAEVLGIAPQEQVETFIQQFLSEAKTEALQMIDHLYNRGIDLNQFVRSVLAELRRGLLIQDAQTDEDVTLKAIEIFSETLREMRSAPDPRIPLEVATLKVATRATVFQMTEMRTLERKVSALEKEIGKLEAQIISKRSKEHIEQKQPSNSRPLKPATTDAERSALVLEVWPDYLQELRDERLMQCEAFLKEGSPVGATLDSVIVSFPRDRGFHKASIEQDNHREPAERVLGKLVGAQLRIKCVFQDEEEVNLEQIEQQQPTIKMKPTSSPMNKTAQSLEKSNSNNEDKSDAQQFIDKSLETFGGKIFTKTKEK